jgi:hypothetical protein
MLGFRFDRAPAHDDYPEGGLRVSGVLPGNSNTSLITNDTTALGGWGTTGTATALIAPTGATISATSFALLSSTGPMAVFAQFFRQWRCRYLAAEYNGLVAPGDTTLGAKQVQLAYERDPVTAEQTAATYTIDTAVTSMACHRFAAWTPEILCPLIDEKKVDRSDDLFYMTAAGDDLTAANDAEIRQVFQGAVTSTISSVAAGDSSLGKVLWHFTFDLYGWTNLANGLLPQRRRRERKELPDAELDFISVKPERLRIDPDRGDRKDLPSVRTSSKK